MNISGKEIVSRMAEKKEIKEYVQALGIPAQTISNWKTRDAAPKAQEVYDIAEYLGVSTDWLLTGKEANGISPEEAEILRKYKSLEPCDQNAVNVLLEGLYRQEKDKS